MRTNRRWPALVVASGLAAATVTGCSSAPVSTAPAPGAVGSTCGTTRTGANVPVVIKVAKGSVNCTAAMSIEKGYAALLKDGKVQGNGGGAPVAVNGWTCQGYPTPEVLKTGNASECRTGGDEVVAVIQLPSSGG